MLNKIRQMLTTASTPHGKQEAVASLQDEAAKIRAAWDGKALPGPHEMVEVDLYAGLQQPGTLGQLIAQQKLNQASAYNRQTALNQQLALQHLQQAQQNALQHQQNANVWIGGGGAGGTTGLGGNATGGLGGGGGGQGLYSAALGVFASDRMAKYPALWRRMYREEHKRACLSRIVEET